MLKKQAFTLVELLVVITILAIISVVAYQNFG
ncbi:MAG: prepilin-type N-terminal cleavage/methylation domain-containing protein [Candidatus Pacebacteria bacterium]|nr:prepilin-type N-terminal cleavage/methylation domain-containing protein [Candidatus Paceibacterota bacterium]